MKPLSIDDPGLIPALERNYRAFWATLDASPLIQVEHRPEGMRYVTGVPYPVMNGIMGPKLPPDDVALATEMEYFIERKLPMTWTIGPGDAPADIGERLQRLGALQTSTNPGMVLDLNDLNEEAPQDRFEIVEVSDEASFRTFSKVLCDAFELPESAAFAQLFIDAGTGEDGSLASFLGLLNGEPVATSRAVLTDGLAGIYTVATNEAARGKGIGSAITLAACIYGKRKGYEVGGLQASAMGHSVYLRMGFRDVCEFRDFTWTGT